MSTVRIDDATFDDGDHQYVWMSRGDVEASFPDGGHDEGTIAIRLDVDGQMDIVYGVELHNSGDVAALDRAILALQRVRDGLAGMYGGKGEPGRCWEQGDTGRCCGQLGHDETDNHEFPTKQDAQTLRAIAAGGLQAAS